MKCVKCLHFGVCKMEKTDGEKCTYFAELVRCEECNAAREIIPTIYHCKVFNTTMRQGEYCCFGYKPQQYSTI